MYFCEFDGPCLFMQGIDVLRHEEKLPTAIAVPSLELREREVGSVWLRPQCSQEALAVPLPRADRVALEETIRSQLCDVACPHGAFVGTAKGRYPTGKTDPGTREHEYQPPLGRKSVDEQAS